MWVTPDQKGSFAVAPRIVYVVLYNAVHHKALAQLYAQGGIKLLGIGV